MARASKTSPKSAVATSQKNGCTLTVKPKVLLSNLMLLNAAVTSNQQGLDRLSIEVVNSQSIFSVGGDIGVRIIHKANKTSSSAPVQVSCRQLKNYAGALDDSNHKLQLSPEQVTISNQQETYQHTLITYKDLIPEHHADFTPVAAVKALEFKQALDRVATFTDNDLKNIVSGICLQLKPASTESQTESDSWELTITGISEPGMGQITLRVDSLKTDDLSKREDITLVLPKKAATFIANNAEDFILAIAEKSRRCPPNEFGGLYAPSVRFSWGNVECTVQTLKGNFPDLEKVKASLAGNDTSVEFNRNELLAALKRHQVASSEIEFRIDAEECTLLQATEAGSGAENIYCSNDHGKEAIRLSLAIDYLIKVVAAVKSEIIKLQLNLLPEAGEEIACNNILVEDHDALYCLTQLVSVE
jgi:DNA polymerase III sliding clamp (beta) subunit (PCNA family)